jgi:RecB family exonuclease
MKACIRAYKKIQWGEEEKKVIQILLALIDRIQILKLNNEIFLDVKHSEVISVNDSV